MASVAERIYELVKTLPESKAERVLGYVQGVIDGEEKPLPVIEEEHAAWCERLHRTTTRPPPRPQIRAGLHYGLGLASRIRQSKGMEYAPRESGFFGG